jgi:hypothetical protein
MLEKETHDIKFLSHKNKINETELFDRQESEW